MFKDKVLSHNSNHVLDHFKKHFESHLEPSRAVSSCDQDVGEQKEPNFNPFLLVRPHIIGGRERNSLND